MSRREWFWCRQCAHRVRYVSDRYAYVHEQPNADHAPIPTTRKPEAVA